MRITEIQNGEINITLGALDALAVGRALEAAALDALGLEVPSAFWGNERSTNEATAQATEETFRILESMSALFQAAALAGQLQGTGYIQDADRGLAWLRARQGAVSMREAVERRRAAMSPPAPGQGGEAPTTPGDEQGDQQNPDGSSEG